MACEIDAYFTFVLHMSLSYVFQNEVWMVTSEKKIINFNIIPD